MMIVSRVEMKDPGLHRLAGLVALTAFTVYGAGAFAGPPDFGIQQPGDAWHLWLLSPELPAGQVPSLGEAHRLAEAPPAAAGPPLARGRPSRGPPA